MSGDLSVYISKAVRDPFSHVKVSEKRKDQLDPVKQALPHKLKQFRNEENKE